ncbi:hypothetical protein FRC07_012386 [Ceratobasidium sp. 392]|nr:hypothetical protein FRC07_012386 [Ceratobasidium sp. 392]
MPAQSSLDAVQFSTVADELDAELKPPPPDFNDKNDPTMPSWGVADVYNHFDSGGLEEEAGGSKADVPTALTVQVNISGSGVKIDEASSSSSDGVAAEWSTDNVAKVDMGDIGDFEPEGPTIPAPPDSPRLANPDPVPQADPEMPAAKEDLPNALCAYQELLLKLASDGDLTVTAANTFLKTLNMCLEKDLLRCGPNANAAHRLPATLETLQKQVSKPSDMLKIYVMCPDFSCQQLKELLLLDLDKPHTCSNPKCKKPITQQKTIRQRGSGKVIYRHIPFYQYGAGSTKQQLWAILERPGNLEAIDQYREALRKGSKDSIV